MEMDISTEINRLKTIENFDTFLSPDHENESDSQVILQQNAEASNLNFKSLETKKSKEVEKLKHGLPLGSRSVYQCKYFKPPVAKRKSVPIIIRMSNPSAEAVLRERKVEIKDLESQVVYLQNRIKELKMENKTLVDLQTRQERELRKFKGGVADIPALLRSHKDEIKAVESSASSLRRELRDCQKDLKMKSDVILRKDQNLDKLNLNLRRIEKRLHEVNTENKELKLDKKRLEEESKKLVCGNEELKSKTERMQKKIQQMTSTILNLEEKLGTAEHFKAQLEDDLSKMQKKYEESLQNITELKKSLQTSKHTTSTQTDGKEMVSISCMTTDIYFLPITNNKFSVKDLKEKISTNGISVTGSSDHIPLKDNNTTSINLYGGGMMQKSRTQKSLSLQPLHSNSSPTMRMLEENDFVNNRDFNIIKSIASDSSLQSKQSASNKSHYNAIMSMGSQVDSSIKKNSVKESVHCAQISFNSNIRHSLPNARQKKRLFSNFTVKQCCTPTNLNSYKG